MSDRPGKPVDYPLHRAALEGKADTLAVLLDETDADVDARDDQGCTALHWASLAGQIESVRLLIEHGASVDAADERQNTPVMFGAVRGHTLVVKLLLDAGANPEILNALGQDAQVLAAIADAAPAARILREAVLSRRLAASETGIHTIGAQLTGLPANKAAIFTGGDLRESASLSNEPLVDGDPSLATEMLQSIPLTTFEGWLKQIDGDELNPIGQIALDRAFPLFLSWVDFSEDDAHTLLTRRGYGVGEFHRPLRARRFAGDDTLPRGRYYTVCRDEHGHDSGALIGELYAYYRAQTAGMVALVDSANERAIRELEESGLWTLPRLATPFIAVMLVPSGDAPNPIARLFGVDSPNVMNVLLPVTVRRTKIERVLDLRQPRAAEWFARYFSRLVVDVGTDGEHKWIRCCPNRPTLESIETMLPTLLTQERGGGLFCQMAGSWLRQNGVNALVYPSARNDTSVEVVNGDVIDWSAWNLVDYRDAGMPQLRIFFDISNYWEEKVRVGLGLGVGELPSQDPYMAARVEYVSEGERAGSWRVVGIVEIKQAVMAAERERCLAPATDSPYGNLTWVNALPVEQSVKEWIKLFVMHDYKTCVARGVALLPTIASFEMLQMFVISLQRSGSDSAGGGWNADEVLEQLTPQLLQHHQHDAGLYRLLAITLGVSDADRELERETDRTERCRILYYAAARAITQQQRPKARQYLDACIETAGECLESHLALAHRIYDFGVSS